MALETGGVEIRFPRGRTAAAIVIGVLIVASLGLRTIELGADPDYSWLSNDVGYLVDEGYKTLDARNLLVFGQQNWNEADEYSGWMEDSPLTQWPFYFSFKWLGLDRTSARLVNVAFFGLLMIGAVLFFHRRYGASGALLGTTLLGADVALFQFSRIATFEIAVCLFVYAAFILTALLWESGRRVKALLAGLAGAAAGVFGVKLSVLLYVTPAVGVLAGGLLYRRLRGDTGSTRRVNWGISVLVVAIAVLLYLTRGEWAPRLDLAFLLSDPYRLVFNPLHQLSPLALGLAYLVVIDVLLREGIGAFRRNAVLALSAGVTVLTPLMLAMFRYNPPRYYVAVIPAAVFIVVEWYHLRGNEGLANEYRLKWSRIAPAVPILLLLLGTLTQFGAQYILPLLAFIPQGEGPGLSRSATEMVFPLVVMVGLSVAGLLLVRRLLNPVLAAATKVGIGVHLVASVLVIGTTLQSTAYVTAEIRGEIVRNMEEGATVGGDWAPYFLLETNVPVLYMTKDMNPPGDMEELRLDYFLNSNTVWDQRNLEGLRSNPALNVTTGIKIGKAFGRDVVLHRLDYETRNAPAGSHTPLRERTRREDAEAW